MKRKVMLIIILTLSAVMLASCGQVAKKSEKNSSGATTVSQSTTSTATQGNNATVSQPNVKSPNVQAAAQAIAKMLNSIQSDSVSIGTDDNSTGAANSSIDEINKALNSGQDDITGVN